MGPSMPMGPSALGGEGVAPPARAAPAAILLPAALCSAVRPRALGKRWLEPAEEPLTLSFICDYFGNSIRSLRWGEGEGKPLKAEHSL